MIVNFMMVMIATFIMISIPRHIIVSGTKKNSRNSERVVSKNYVPRYFPDEREEPLLAEPVSELVDEPFPFSEKEKAEILSALPADWKVNSSTTSTIRMDTTETIRLSVAKEDLKS